jgi:transposase
MGFIGGVLQERLVGRIRDSDRQRLLAVPIDVGKRSATSLVADFWGEIVADPFEFTLDERGFARWSLAVARASAARDALWVRVGLEQAGHYHRPLLARLVDAGFEVGLLNPTQVKENRAQDLLLALKSDERDLGAMADLLIRGKGHGPEHPTEAMVTQAVLVSYRSSKLRMRTILKNQILAHLDLVFPGLQDCFADFFESRFARLLLEESFDPARVRRLGSNRIRSYCLRRGLKVTKVKVTEVVDTAHNAFMLPAPMALAHARALASDVALLSRIDHAIADAEKKLEDILSQTPAGILTTIPYVAVVRASDYGAAVGDVRRFRNAGQVYRLAGLVPKLYESAGRRRPGTQISREGRPELRNAILALGKALRTGHGGFARYARELDARGKEPGVVACALGHKANRVAFAMMRDQTSFEPTKW